MIVYEGPSLTVRDAPMPGVDPYRLKVATTTTAGETLDADQVRDLHDRLGDWLEACGR